MQQWRVVQAVVTGTAHSACGLPCQDFCYSELVQASDGADYLVSLVADGAGSAKAGELGAALACMVAMRSITATLADPLAKLDQHTVAQWIQDIQCMIESVAKEDTLMARDYACTILGAVVGPQHKVLFFQIGDGAIVASSNGVQGVVFWPDPGLYANMTHFVTDTDAMEHLRVVVTDADIDELAIFSDGLQRLALGFEQRIPHLPFFAPMLKVLRTKRPAECVALDEQLAKFLSSSSVNMRTDDDKTLVLATRCSSS